MIPDELISLGPEARSKPTWIFLYTRSLRSQIDRVTVPNVAGRPVNTAISTSDASQQKILLPSEDSDSYCVLFLARGGAGHSIVSVPNNKAE